MILVTGATGNVGAELVGQLASDGVAVRGLVRNADAVLPEGAHACVGDLNEPESLVAALEGVRGVFLLPGYRDMPGLLARVRAAGAERVVLLSGRSVLATEVDNAISRYMLASEDAVRRSGVSWTFLRPAGFMSNALRWKSQITARDVVRAPFAQIANALIDPYDIARVAAVALLSAGHDGEAYPLSGPESLRPADELRVLGELLGRELRLEALSNEEARVEMEADMPAEYVHAFFRFYVDGVIDESEVLPTVEEITGAPPRTFRQWAQAHLEAFR
jgi:uncharacterized protein YbjT (DUF2867 family)